MIGAGKMKHVLITEPIHEAGVSLLKARSDVQIVEGEDARPETLARLIPEVEAIIARSAKLPADLLSTAPRLEVVSRHGVGCDSVAVDHLTSRGIPMAIATGANSTSVAEHVFAHILTLSRKVFAQHDAVRSGNFLKRDGLLAADLEGAVLLVVGFGNVGRKVAARARAFDMDVIVADIALDTALAQQLGCRWVDDFHDALAEADFVTLHVPLDGTTRNLVAADEFAQMKPGAVLINCARGGVVDEAAMLEALTSDRLAGAGLDVFSVEPPQNDDPQFAALAARPDVLLTPHTGAASYGAMREMARMAAQNVLDVFDGTLKPECTFNFAELKSSSSPAA